MGLCVTTLVARHPRDVSVTSGGQALESPQLAPALCFPSTASSRWHAVITRSLERFWSWDLTVFCWPIVPIQHLNRNPPFAWWKNIGLRSTTKESVMESTQIREPWNKGKLVGQKRPLKPKDIWAIRIHLQNAHRDRDLAMFNLAIDSKLRGCDLVNLRVRDIANGNQILTREWSCRERRSGLCNSS